MSKMTSDTHMVGGGYSVRFSFDSALGIKSHIQCVWTPRKPSQADLRDKVDDARYQDALRQFTVWIMAKGGVK